MRKFKHIAVLQDARNPASHALLRAARLAEENDAKLSVFDIVSSPTQFVQTVLDGIDGMLDEVADSRTKRLEHIVSELGNDINCSARVLRGRPLPEILKAIAQSGCDLLIKNAKAKTADLFFGSLDMRLLRYCPVPLWLTKEDAPKTSNRVLAAIDPTATNDWLNDEIIRLASGLAKRESAELHVVSVWQAPLDLLVNCNEYQDNCEKYRRRIESAARSTLNRVIGKSQVKVPESCVHFCSGVENDEIVEVVEKTQPDVLVMGTLARTGLAGILIGNTAEKVLRRVQCSVLTLKASGFKSPLTSYTA